MNIFSHIRSFIPQILGYTKSQTTPQRLYIGSVIIVILVLIPIALSNYLIGLDRRLNYIILFFGIPVLLVLYYLARFRNYFSVSILTTTILIFLSVSWIFNGGSSGTLPVIYLVSMLIMVGISKPKYHYLIFFIFFFHLTGMLLLEEFVIEDMIVPYPSTVEQTEDIIFAFAAAMFIVFWILRFYIMDYIAKNKKLEQQKLELEKNISLKNMYFTIMVHDLKGSFNNILGFTDIMSHEDETLSLDKYQRFAKLTKLSAESSYSLLNDILELSRIQQDTFKLKKEKLNLKVVADSVVGSFAMNLDKKAISLKNEIKTDIWINSDLFFVETILRNFLHNAIKFTQNGGEIKLFVEDYSEEEIALSVSDTGIGMDKKHVENIFKIDFNSKRPGTDDEPSNGIGLKICNELIQKEGRQIFVKSEAGKGSTFSFTIQKFV